MAEWFAPKRYGYGSGRPISWQGWAVVAAFVAIVVAAGALLDGRAGLQAMILLPATALLLLIAARTTRGGWRWRWGDRN